jgi:hypothetical protein
VTTSITQHLRRQPCSVPYLDLPSTHQRRKHTQVIFISFTWAELFGGHSCRCSWHSQPGTLAEGTQTINFGPENPVGDLMVGRRRRGMTPKLWGQVVSGVVEIVENGLNSVRREVMLWECQLLLLCWWRLDERSGPRSWLGRYPGLIECPACTREDRGTAGDGLPTCDGVANLRWSGRQQPGYDRKNKCEGNGPDRPGMGSGLQYSEWSKVTCA